MIEKLRKLKKEGLVKFKEGKAKDIKDFFEQIIKPQFDDNENTIKSIHKALIKFVMSEKAVYAVRLYFSYKRNHYDRLRRGFLTVYPDGKKMLFCDNTFAMPFVALKLHGENYTCEELIEYLNQSNVLCGFSTTEEERELAFYSCQSENRINLNSEGWYLAHILPVGYEYKKGSISRMIPNPDRKEWEVFDDKIRYVKEDMPNDILEVLRAHFLRLVHPLNSFVVPKRSLLKYEGKNIGEEKELINIVRDYIKIKFPKEYMELSKIIQAPVNNPLVDNITHKIGKIIWYSPTNVKNMKISSMANKKKSVLENSDDKISEYEKQVQKVRRRVPGWKRKLDQVNSRILGLFMELSDNGKNGVFVDMLEDEFGTKYPDEADLFRKNYVQMKYFGANNHAKVFEEDDEKTVWLWEPVKDFIIETYSF